MINLNVLGVIIILSGTFYILILVNIFVALNRRSRWQRKITPSISLVITARNEQNCIIPFLQSIEQLDYPSDRLEVILVDDASTDATALLIARFCMQHSNWKLLSLGGRNKLHIGQMAALAEGIASSQGEIIVTTDADCVVQRSWLRKMVGCFAPNVSMVIGYCSLKIEKKTLHWFLAFDNLFSAVIQAGFTRMGFPQSSSGGNLAYRRSAYDAVGGFSSLKNMRSGSDTLLTLLFFKKKIGKIAYCDHPQSFVQTLPPETVLGIIFRQIRTNSNTIKKPLLHILFCTMSILSYWSLFVLLFLLVPWKGIGICALLARYLIEFACLTKGAHLFGQKRLIILFPIMQLVYPLSLIFFGVLGAGQLYYWKEQRMDIRHYLARIMNLVQNMRAAFLIKTPWFSQNNLPSED